MSNILSDYKKREIEWQLELSTELPKQYANRQEAADHELLFCSKIPHALLQIWGDLLKSRNTINDEVNYIDLFNLTVRDGWFALKRDCRRVNELLRKRASLVKSSLSKSKGRRYYKLRKKEYSLNIRKGEVQSMEQLKADVEKYQQEVQEWKEKYSNLEEEKKKMYEETQKEMS